MRMSKMRKSRPARKTKQTRKWVAAIAVLLLIIMGIATARLWLPSEKTVANSHSEENAVNSQNQATLQPSTGTVSPTTSINEVTPTPSPYELFTEQYLTIMEHLNSSGVKSEMATLLNPNYNQTDLFSWEHSKLAFTQDLTGFYENPFQILSSGDGICVQWSIVYVSACLALGYQSRLVVAANTANWQFIHVWAEDYYNGVWVHVDPSDGVWNNPSRYQSWGWGTFGTEVKVYAFEDGIFQDATSTYAPQ